MSGKTLLNRSLQAALVAATTFHAGGAAALEFQIGESTLKVENLFTIGASWRMQDIDPTLIGKSTLHRIRNPDSTQGLCLSRVGDDGVSGADPAGNDYGAGQIPALCAFSNPAAAAAFADAPGSFVPNADQGNLNFQKGDVVHAIAKLTSDISFSIADYNFFIRPIYYFDANYIDFVEDHPDTTFYPRSTPLDPASKKRVGSDFEVLDYHVGTNFELGERSLSLKVGNQALNWGESSLLIFNSLNTINPPDATKLRMPGLDLKELLQPVGMVVAGADVMANVSLEAWYQYEWKPLRIDPVGSYFSPSDTLGDGGFHAMLGFGKNPDDPLGIYEPLDTCSAPGMCVDSAGLLGSTASRTLYRDFDEERKRRPDDGGQYGAKLSLFLEDFNNGTEVGLYFANYHSRLPIASFISSDATCIEDVSDLSPVGGCQVTPGGLTPAGVEPVPVDTVKIVVEYPENIRLYGVSFNTTIGDYALSGEYAFRDNLPTQVHTTDLTFAALNPAVPAETVSVDVGVTNVTVPGRREAFPDFVSIYRGITGGYGPNQYIRGYESMKTGQLNISVLRLIGGDNPIGASQMTILTELGMNQVFDMPGLDELQFQGGGTDTHISDGSNASGASGDGINPNDPAINQSAVPHTRRQNVTPHRDLDGFGSSESYGYRILNLNRWDSALFGANLETLAIIQHDVKGTTPGIGTNFVQGRKQFAFGLRFDYLSAYIGEVRYTWFTGGAKRDVLRDRDNIQVSFGIQF